MAITVAYTPGDATAGTGVTTLAQVNNNTITAGQPIFVHLNHANITTVQAIVSDTDGNAYRCVSGPRRFATAGTEWLFTALAKTTRSGTGLTFTVNFSVSGDASLSTVVFAGFTNPALFVGNGSGSGTSTTPSSSVNTGIYTTGVVVQGNGVQNSVTGVGGGATNSVTDGHGCNCEYIIVSSAGVYTPTATQSSGDWTSVIAFLADAPPNPAQTRTRTRVYSFPPDLLVGATLLGQGVLSAPQPPASNALACVMVGVGALIANLTGIGSAPDVGSVKTTLSALAPQLGMPALQYAPLGVGVLSAPQASTGPIAATMAGVGALSANLTGTGALSSTMAGVGSLTAGGFTTLADVGAVRTALLPLSLSLSLPVPGLVPLGTGILQAPQGLSPISATMSGVGALSASLVGSGALADVMAGVGTLSATLGGSGSLASTMAGVGTLSASGITTLADVGSIRTARLALSISTSLPVPGLVPLGTGILQAPQGASPISATMVGVGALTANLAGSGALAATMAGVGTFVGVGITTLADVGSVRATLLPLALSTSVPIAGLTPLGTGILQAPQGGSPISATMVGIGALSASLIGSGALADTMSGVGTLSAALTGSGALADTMVGVGAFTATLLGTLSDVGSIRTQSRPLTLTLSAPIPGLVLLGQGVLSAPQPLPPGFMTVAMNGVGALVATLLGSGALADVMAGVGSLTAGLGGTGALSDTMAGVGALATSLSGTGALADVMVGTGALVAGLTGVGALAMTAAGIGALSATLTAGAVSSMAGVGALFASLSGTGFIGVTMNGVGALSAQFVTNALTVTLGLTRCLNPILPPTRVR